MMMTYLFCLSPIVTNDHFLIPLASSPCFVALGLDVECMIVSVPHDLYDDDHVIVYSEVYIDTPF